MFSRPALMRRCLGFGTEAARVMTLDAVHLRQAPVLYPAEQASGGSIFANVKRIRERRD
jgi:hypothetical protein